MPDSIFDLKQTLFTSNLPVPTPRDRGSEKLNDFDQALNSAQRQSRDDHRASHSPEASAANNSPTDDTAYTDEAPQPEHDEVTLSQHASEAAQAKPTESVKGKKTKSDDIKSVEHKEPTAEEIAAAVAAPQAPTKPVLKQLPEGETEHAELYEGIELNDAVQPGGKQRGLSPTDKKYLAPSVPTDAIPTKQIEVNTATTDAAATDPDAAATHPDAAATHPDAAATDPDAAVVALNFHSNRQANEKKIEAKTNNKAGTDKAITYDQKHANEEADTAVEGEHNEGAFAVTLTPAAESETPVPKRRLETTQQTMPDEVHEAGFRLVESLVVNAESTATAVNNDVAAETTASSEKTPVLPTVCHPGPETSAPPNHLRGPQIPGSFANRLEAASNERKSNDSLNGVDRTRFVQRVARAFQRVGETEGEIRLRLSPPELGAVKLEIALRDGAMIARMETETTAARNLLMDNLPQLKEKLAEQNVRIETFEVEVRDQSRQDGAEDAKEQLREQQEQQRNRLRGERATAPVVAAPIVRTLPAARQSSQLNVII